MKTFYKTLLGLSFVTTLAACSGGQEGGHPAPSSDSQQVVIYTNADDEAVKAMETALQKDGFGGQYIVQTFGTSELGGRLLAEGKNIEADVVTMSSYYIDSAQKKSHMFKNLSFTHKTLQPSPAYATPITSQEGAMIVNTKMLADENLPRPTSIKDLANPIYKDKLAITDPNGSSTAWLLVQDVISTYGDGNEGKKIINGIIENAGAHVSQSGSAPLKMVRAGEVAVGFGLRHQAVADKNKGLPIDYIDPSEGNFSLTESIAVVDKNDKTNPLAMKMVEAIIKDGRPDLLKTYPNPLYQGEVADPAHQSAHPKVFNLPLTVELLEKHQAFFHNKY